MYTTMLQLKEQAVILGVNVDDISQYGVLLTDERGFLVDFREKRPSGDPGVVDAGFYLFKRSFLEEFDRRHRLSLEYDVFPNAKRIAVVRHIGIWHDIGSV